MAHTVFIVLHALSGAVAFGCGCLALRRTAWFAAYFWSLLAMVAFVGAAVAVSWTEFDLVTRLLFSGLGLLAAVMIWRAVLARQLVRAGGRHPTSGFVDHVGFTVISLLDAFVVVAVLDLAAPVWAVVAAGVVGGIAGHVAIGRVRRALLSASAAA